MPQAAPRGHVGPTAQVDYSGALTTCTPLSAPLTHMGVCALLEALSYHPKAQAPGETATGPPPPSPVWKRGPRTPR